MLGADQPFLYVISDSQLESQIDGTNVWLENPDMTLEENHENWMKYKEQAGWKYGNDKCFVCKTHPDMVPYEQLPEIEQRKDDMDIRARRFALWLWEQVNEG
jgi:hypothetical protein